MSTTVLICALYLLATAASAQRLAVTAQVQIENPTKSRDASEVVVWLSPLHPDDAPAPSAVRPRLVQRNKSFEPHLLVVPVGSVVEFPNRDPFFHNVFSLFDGKRFDLGLYEAGATRDVHFDRPGISFIFCNIHPQMSAVVIALDTPYYAVSGPNGSLTLPDVPPGRYMLHVWDERATQETLKALSREVSISADHRSLGDLHILETTTLLAHKNKYGRDYDTPAAPDSIYKQP